MHALLMLNGQHTLNVVPVPIVAAPIVAAPIVVGVEQTLLLRELEGFAAGGSVDAILLLARMYHRGEGNVKVNLHVAFQYYCMAARAGDVVAILYVGLCYLHGKGVQPDKRTAFAWVYEAAKRGLAQAQFTLCCMYLSGTGVTKNHQQASMWSKLAAKDPVVRRKIESLAKSV